MTTVIKVAFSIAAALLLLSGCEIGSKEVDQIGYRGVGMEKVNVPGVTEELLAANQLPEGSPPVPAAGPPASAIYRNVQVLGDVSIGEFTRLMTAITEWVAPEQGCAYCHAAGEGYEVDTLYTKIVSRRMLQMTLDINNGWSAHVADTGVTCYTCHRGKNVPEYIWFEDPGPKQSRQMAANPSGQNIASPHVGSTSLPYDPFSAYLQDSQEGIRVVSNHALPRGSDKTIQNTEKTYGLMIHMSESLGQNCTFCHNSRAFTDWEQSSPVRTTAWHGLQMVGALNTNYLNPLQPEYPDNRLGPSGDAPKLNCKTCHQGVSKPLLGQSMLPNYPNLAAKK